MHLTLAMETSCDETSVAIIGNGRQILANVVSSQVPLHQKYGGVVPEIASRKHIESVLPVMEEAFQQADRELKEIDLVAVTYGPGLVGALLVGVSAAKALAFALDKPLVGVNHLEGHIFANFLCHPALEPPFLSLVVSGGHTALVHVKDYQEMTLLGQTRDDAAGEVFDKIARVMGLPYPGGPEIDRLAKTGNRNAVVFPRALIGEGNFEFSFSGLKSAVLNYLHTQEQKKVAICQADVAASFQEAVVQVLVDKTMAAAKATANTRIALAGGVAANSNLREALRAACVEQGYELIGPSLELCGDNAAMIGCRGYYQLQAGDLADLHLNAVPSLSLSKPVDKKK